MRRVVLVLVLAVALVVGLIAAGNLGIGPVVITREGERQIILRFGEARRVTDPGWALRLPLIEDAEAYDHRLLWLNTEPLPIQTKDEERIVVDNYVIWRIRDPVAFRRAFPGGGRATAKAAEPIDKAVRNDVREVIGRHTLGGVLKDSREAIMKEITAKTRQAVAEYGIDVVDVRINRTELPEGTDQNVYARMKTERERLARKNRAEGEERARRIRAEADRDALVIVADAKRDAMIARGEGDAEAARIYAEAYGSSPEFYAFLRSLEAYRKAIDSKTTLVLSPDAEFFRFLEQSRPGSGPPEPARGEP